LKKVVLLLVCALFLISGCTNITDYASAVETDTPEAAYTQQTTQNPEETILTPVVTPTEQLPSPTPTSVVEATPMPTPTSSNYKYYKKLAVSTYYTTRQLVGVDPVSQPVENTTNDPDMFRLTIDLTNKVVKVYKKAGNEYVLYRLMICTIGQSGYSTPKGTFYLTGYHVRFGYFSKYNCYAQYWSQIKGQILFHSILFSRKENTAYRATSYNNLGKAASHGCVRLSVPDAKWIYENCPKGTQVTIGSYKKDADLVKAVKLPALK